MLYMLQTSKRAVVRSHGRTDVYRRLAIALALVSSMSCGPQPQDGGDPIAALFSGSTAEWIDLSHPYDERTIFWPTARPFELEVVAAGVTEAGFYYAANNFCMAEHGGTHLDAPIHFSEGRHTTEQIPIQTLVGPAIVVDVRAAAEGDPDYRVSVSDLEAWEAEHGQIPEGAILKVK